MSATIAILGANGVYARHLIPRLTEANFKVRALVRRIAAANVTRACGADVRVADIFDAASLRDGLNGADVCINLLAPDFAEQRCELTEMRWPFDRPGLETELQGYCIIMQ